MAFLASLMAVATITHNLRAAWGCTSDRCWRGAFVGGDFEPRVPDAVQRGTKWSGAPLIRDRHRPERSTQVGFTRLAHLQAPISGKPEIGVCSASLRHSAPKTRVNALMASC